MINNNICQAYKQILSTENNDNSHDVVQELTTEIFKHLNYFVDKIDYQNYFKLENLKTQALDIDRSFNEIKEAVHSIYQIECEDPVTLRFKITDLNNQKSLTFSILTEKLSSLIKDKYDFSFQGGTISSPSSNQYFVYKNGFKMSDDFKMIRNENIKKLKEINQFDLNTINKKIKEGEKINDILLQYMGYFRN